jgi:signal transduction histidine kinase
LSWIVPRYRDLWRFRAPLSSGEIRRTERWLATARVALTIAAQLTLWMEPARRESTYSNWLYWLLTVYLVHAVVVMLLVRFRHQSTLAFRLVVHGADIVWPVLISMFTTTQRPFFLFFVFVMAAAAYRWGMWETVGTAGTAVVLLWAEASAVRSGLTPALDAWLRSLHLPPLGVSVRELNPQQLFMSSVYLMVLGLLLGYMSENEKKLRAERAVITRILSSARVEAGLTNTMQETLGEVLNIYRARRVLSASQELNSYRVFLAEISRGAEGTEGLRWREAQPDNAAGYLFTSRADGIYAERSSKGFNTVLLDRSGKRLREEDTGFLETLARVETFHSLASVAFVFGREWSGRVFLFDPEKMGDPEEELRFLQEFAQQVGPAVYNVYLMRRLRERAGALERARFARELHDGAIQSLIGVELQLDVLRRQSGQAPVVSSELGRIQQLLREEVLKLRELMQAMKSFEVNAERLPGFIADTVERFRRETGISAEFSSEVKRVELPQRVCRELARIVQESLVNVRKHSGARHVLVRLAQRSGNLQLTVEDDGKGFPFSGRLSEAELATTGKGPAVIRERVRLLAGELTIESNPGHGARLEVKIPPARQVNDG